MSSKLVRRVKTNLPKNLDEEIINELAKEISGILSRELSSEEIEIYIKSDYPRIDNSDFLIKLTKLMNVLIKVDDILAETSESYEGMRCKIEKSELFYFQRNVTKYLHRNSPYRGIQLFYGLGAGKTRTSIAICNSFIEEGRKILVLTPASLEENFRKEYETYTPPYLRGNKLGLLENFEFLHYNAPNFAKSREDQEDQLFDKVTLDGKVIIIDEVHNFISLIVNAMRANRSRGIRIYNKIMNAKDIRIVALSGTPIINFPFETAILINILVGYLNSSNDPWTESDGSNKYPVFREDEEEFNRIYLESNSKSKEYKIKETTINAFCKRLIGNISYYGGLVGGGIYPDLSEYIVKMEMSDHQFDIYLEQRLLEVAEQGKKFVPGKELDMDIVEKKSSFRSSTRELCNFAFPSEIVRPWRKEISQRYSSMSKEKKEKKYLDKLEIGNIFEEKDEKEKDEDIQEDEISSIKVLEEELKKGTSSTRKKAIIDKIYHYELEEKLNELDEVKDVYLSTNYDDTSIFDYCKLEDITNLEDDIETKPYKLFKCDGKFDVDTPNLLKYSPKMLSILYNIEKSRIDNIKLLEKAEKLDLDISRVHRIDGNVVIYSYFNRVEGINIMQKVLETAGYEQYNLSMGKKVFSKSKSKGRYCFWEGKDRDKILEIFNAPYNKYGNVIKILLITEAGAEGITLKNVRQMHIMEPYWNEVQIRQVIGRAKRMYSHKSLGKPTLIKDPNTRDTRDLEKIDVYIKKEKQKRIKRNEDGSLLLNSDGTFIYETNEDGTPIYEKRDGKYIYVKNEDGKYKYLIDVERLDSNYNIDIPIDELVSDRDDLEKIVCIVDPFRFGERHVDVFRYKIMFSESQLKKVSKTFKGEPDELLTTDEVLALIANRKKAVTDQIELFMKQTSIDCLNNKEDNDKHELFNGKPRLVCYTIRSSGSSSTQDTPTFKVSETNISKTSAMDIQKTTQVKTIVYDLRIYNNDKLDRQKYIFKRDVRKSEKVPSGLPCIYIYTADAKTLGLSSSTPIGMLIKLSEKDDYEIYKGKRVGIVSKEKEIVAEGPIKYKLILESDGYKLISLE